MSTVFFVFLFFTNQISESLFFALFCQAVKLAKRKGSMVICDALKIKIKNTNYADL